MKTAFSSADILIPENIDMNKWTVVACDQYTSEPEYWDEVYKTVGDCPSTLKLILPELYLEEPDVAQRIDKIHAEMKKYVDKLLSKSWNGKVKIITGIRR